MLLGDLQADIVSDGSLRLDGGAMFGIVPRRVWEQIYHPDEHNRIEVALNCLLLRRGSEVILVDTGAGSKWSEQQRVRYGIEAGRLPENLARYGIQPEDVTMVINTHLHFDHAGGNTYIADGRLLPTFPNARYLVRRAEYEHACNPHERDRASYLSEDWTPLGKQLELLDGDCEVARGVEVFRVPGHNLDTQLVRVSGGGETLVFFADIIPTTAHIPFAWMMGYDLYPVELLEQKKRLIPQAAREGWLCVFEHDPKTAVGRIIEQGGRYKVTKYEEN